MRTPGKIGRRWPKDRVNILLVIARPYAHDVRFRSVARALVEWAVRPEVPAAVHALRPPTFAPTSCEGVAAAETPSRP